MHAIANIVGCIVLAIDAHIFLGLPIKKILKLWGKGGDGKSLLSALRTGTYGRGHQPMSPSVFEQEEEFRKQGKDFAWALALTIEECNGGSLLLESIFKAFVHGEMLHCRGLFCKENEYFAYLYQGKFWNMNEHSPSILPGQMAS